MNYLLIEPLNDDTVQVTGVIDDKAFSHIIYYTDTGDDFHMNYIGPNLEIYKKVSTYGSKEYYTKKEDNLGEDILTFLLMGMVSFDSDICRIHFLDLKRKDNDFTQIHIYECNNMQKGYETVNSHRIQSMDEVYNKVSISVGEVDRNRIAKLLSSYTEDSNMTDSLNWICPEDTMDDIPF